MNETAFVIGTVVALSYYLYSKNKARTLCRQNNDREEERTPNQPKGGDNQ
jgi:hypothetical protein